MSEIPERLTKSAEDYLEAIGHLCRQHGHAHVGDIAERLRVKKPSVTAAMRQLAAEGYIEYFQYSPIVLTEKGLNYANTVIHAHDILHRFLEEQAGLTPQRADEAACLIEHILTYEEIKNIGARLSPPSIEQK